MPPVSTLLDDQIQQPLLIQCITFNVGSEIPDSFPSEFLAFESGHDAQSSIVSTTPDIYAVGTQETASCSKWEQLLREHLAEHGLVLLAGEQLLFIQLLLFVRIELIRLIENVHTFKVATGVGNVTGNKGSVAITLTLTTGHRILFINSHFTAHESKVEERKEDYERMADLIIRTKLNHSSVRKARETFFRRKNRIHDEQFAMTKQQLYKKLNGQIAGKQKRRMRKDVHLILWLGDLNYRVDGNRGAVEQALKDGYFEVLRNNDQLSKEKRKRRIFQGYQEGVLSFPPTYKFDKGTDNYDTSAKLRIPSWPDRILWKSASTRDELHIELLSYRSLTSVQLSDHKPVVATFVLHLKELHPRHYFSRRSTLLSTLRKHCFHSCFS